MRKTRLRYGVYAAVVAGLCLLGMRALQKPETAPVVIATSPTSFGLPQGEMTREPAVPQMAATFDPKPAAAPAVVSTPVVAEIEQKIGSYLEPGATALTSARKVVIGKGDTLLDLLVKKGAVPKDDAYKVVQALKKVYNPRDLVPGRKVTVFFHRDPSIADPTFSGLRIEKDVVSAVAVKRDDDGGFTASAVEKDVRRHLRGFRGKISSSLYEDASAQGVPDSVILDLIKMYSWNVDFQRGIHEGDKFEVMYEEYKTEDGQRVPGRGNIVYARLTLGGEEMPFTR